MSDFPCLICTEADSSSVLISRTRSQKRIPHDRHGSEQYIVQLVDPWLIQSLPGETRPVAKEKLHNHIKYILVERPAHHISIASVALAAVHKKQGLQVLKLCDWEVCWSGSLHTLSASDSNTYISFQDHGNIISSITDSETRLPRMPLLNQLNNVAFLGGTYSAGDHDIDLISDLHQQIGKVLLSLNFC